ncbi:hypothetical protein [Lutibaculum baratangense]|uniref:Uncharacterized protein n=1 Tax=Lutibaculum baratangense AMV1 TaxID=631454 RepID=V4QWL3_9HYPH|nr:hypothetical protein [Lutibaculum baratangense]ESR24137.1 hypothetical protein N177_2586 [Lutibaculum baratangense AMV1]
MRTSTTLAVALAAVVLVVALSAAVQPRAEVTLDSRILSWFDLQDWW